MAFKIISKPYDLMYNSKPVCPKCGHEMQDACELDLQSDGDSTEVECGECGEDFKVELDLEITYNTYPVENKSAEPAEKDDLVPIFEIGPAPASALNILGNMLE